MGLLELDRELTLAVYHWVSASQFWTYLFLGVAALFVYAIPVVLLYLFFKNGLDRLNSFKLFFATIVTWRLFSNTLGDIFYGAWHFRDRPFATAGLPELFFEQPIKAFPSDHAAVLGIVTLMSFFLGYRQLGWVFLVGTLLSSLGRVAVGFHYFGDILGGLLVATAVFGLMVVFDRPLGKFAISLWKALSRQNLTQHEKS